MACNNSVYLTPIKATNEPSKKDSSNKEKKEVSVTAGCENIRTLVLVTGKAC
jgi:hypothetical protein